MPFTRNILTSFCGTSLLGQTRDPRRDPVLLHFAARDSRDWSSRIKLAHARKKFGASILRREEKNSRDANDDDDGTMTIGHRGSVRRSPATRRRRRAPKKRRKLVSCFVAKVKTVTLLSASLVTAPRRAARVRARERGTPAMQARPSLNIGGALTPPRQTAITSHKARLRHGSAIILPYRAVQKGPAV